MIEFRIVTWPKVSHFCESHFWTCVAILSKLLIWKKFWHENYKNFRQEVHIKISLNHYRPFHFWKLKFSGLSANILSEIRIFSSKYLKMKGSISSYLRVKISIPYITHIIYDIPSIFHNMLPELKTFNFIQEWLGMELGTFVMCQISKMHFSHAFPHS